MDALGATPTGQVLQQVGRIPGDRVPAGQQHLELVDHRDDARPVPGRVHRAQLRQLGDLVLLGGVRPAAQLLGENRSSARPNSRSVLTLMPTSRMCGSQLGSRRPLANRAKDTPSLKSSR